MVEKVVERIVCYLQARHAEEPGVGLLLDRLGEAGSLWIDWQHLQGTASS